MKYGCAVSSVCLCEVCALWVVCECGEWCMSEQCALCIVCGVHCVSQCKVCAL